MPNHDVHDPDARHVFNDPRPEVTLHSHTDRSVTVSIDGKPVTHINYDLHGTKGVGITQKLATDLAAFFHTELNRTYEADESNVELHS